MALNCMEPPRALDLDAPGLPDVSVAQLWVCNKVLKNIPDEQLAFFSGFD
jgi:hypothetical protein